MASVTERAEQCLLYITTLLFCYNKLMHLFISPSRRIINFLVIYLLAIGMFSCAVKQTVQTEAQAGQSAEIVEPGMQQDSEPSGSIPYSAGSDIPPAAEEMNKALPPETYIDTLDSAYKGDYVIGPEDMIQIDVYEVDELKKTLRVSSSGFIKLPLTGKIKVSGLTAVELEEEIGRRLQKYLQEPIVSVFIKEYRSQSITILGAIKKPQVYTVTRQKFLIDMISISGGLTKDAGDICYVRRGNKTIIIQLRDLMVGGNMSLNIPVFSGDLIHVPIGGILFVDGAVNSPGSFGIDGTITLTQAIARARGFKYEASRDKIRIYRDSGKAIKDIIDVDYDDILASKTTDIVLKDKDIIIVPDDDVKKLWGQFINSLRGSTSIGAVSLGGGF